MTARDDWAALGGFVALVAVGNIARSTVVPDAAHFAFNVGLGVAALVVGLRAGLTTSDLGIDRRTWRAGLRLGVVAAGVVGIVLCIAVVTSASALADDVRGDISAPELARRALLVIPLGTVAVEELVFRGVLFGLARRVMSDARAIVGTACVFGLWHVLPAWQAAEGAPAVEALLTLGGTTLAGLAFGWLRARSGSVLAPALAHTATNSGALVAAWLVQR